MSNEGMLYVNELQVGAPTEHTISFTSRIVLYIAANMQFKTATPSPTGHFSPQSQKKTTAKVRQNLIESLTHHL